MAHRMKSADSLGAFIAPRGVIPRSVFSHAFSCFSLCKLRRDSHTSGAFLLTMRSFRQRGSVVAFEFGYFLLQPVDRAPHLPQFPLKVVGNSVSHRFSDSLIGQRFDGRRRRYGFHLPKLAASLLATPF